MWRPIVDFLWPPACPSCLAVGSDLLCATCRGTVAVLPDSERCVPVPGIAAVHACVPYEEPLTALLIQAKYGGNPHTLTALADLLVDLMPDRAALGEPHVVTSIPLSRARRRRRGHDQVLPLARRVARSLDRPLVDALRRLRGGDPQAGLSRTARRRNLMGRFRARGVQGRRVLLVDDVVTTGATLEAAARALATAGASSVVGLCLFRTRERQAQK